MDSKKLLTRGLQKGFGGNTVRKKTTRGPFKVDSGHYETKNGGIYHDEWMADRVGGGQELVLTNGKSYTRVYAGGTISAKALGSLGLTVKDVMVFLKKQILDNGDKIRLWADFKPKPQGDWRYEYIIIDKEKDILVTAGKESIFYKGKLVFVHSFVLSPVE